MRRLSACVMGTILAALMGGVMGIPNAAGGEVGFVEDFALANDRIVALKQLIPGTDDYYYYHSLHYLNAGDLAKFDSLMKTWRGRHVSAPPAYIELETRHALLTFDKDPKKAFEFVQARLGLYFNHQKEVVGVSPNLPSTLDQNLIARETLKKSSLARWGNLSNFEDLALEWMAAEKLSWQDRRHLLSRLQRPDIPNLATLVAEDLAVPSPNLAAFGAYPIHRQMTLAQLDELLKLRPAVLNETNFVHTYITKLHPGADDDWKRDRKLALAYLERLQKFVARLDPVHNSLKAHILFHRLVFDRAEGIYDKSRFVEYLKLPRSQPYMSAAWSAREECRRWPADLNADLTAITLLPRVGSDEPLVRTYLEHFFVDADSTKDFDPYVNDIYLRNLFAETKIINGIGDRDQWSSLLPPELLRQVRDRVDIDFAFTNRTEFGVGEPFTMEVFVKNAPSLLVKVYEINTRHIYRTSQKEIDTDINIDGLVANAERIIPGNADPFRRTSVTLEFPDPTGKLNYPERGRPGVYIIDLIANGKSSRALVRVGRMYPVVSTGTSGQVIHVVDENQKPVPDATVWLAGQEYLPGEDGAIVVPFTNEPGRRAIVMSRGDFACMDFIQHQPESYQLTAGIHIDRESLLSQRVAPVLIRPGLTLNGNPVSVNILEDVRLRITSTDHDGIPSSVEVPHFKLFEDRESIHEIRVPPRLASLNIMLTAKVKSLSSGKEVDLAANQTFVLNQIAKTDKIEDLHLAKFGNDYVLELLGRTGETKADRPVQLSVKHRDFKEAVPVTMKTDATGRVHLGPLADIITVTASNPEGTSHTWNLLTDRHTYRQIVHAKAGAAVTLPYLGTAGKPDRLELALLEVLGSNYRADRFDAIAVNNGMIELRGLAPGDYDLFLKQTGEKLRIRVADAAEADGYLLNHVRHLEKPGLKPVQIESIAAEGDSIVVKLRDASKFARVHIFAGRYQPAFSAFANLSRVRDAELDAATPLNAECVYLTGRNIGDEYRYVLERRNQKKYPGNMLDRPGFLLNPWAVRTTETGEQMAQAGDAFGARGGGIVAGAPLAKPEPAAPAPWNAPPISDFAELDFLYDASAVAVNLVPDEDGIIKLPRKDIGTHAFVHVAAVDPLHTTYRSISLPEEKARFADLRLRDGLDPKRHFTQQKLVTIAEPGKEFVIEDIAGSRFEAYDSLAKVYSLYATLSKDPKLAEFAFIIRWPKLKPEEKRELYSKHACHELNFFLSKKDPEFFSTVVRPYLRNKKDKTFLDHFLLGNDLSQFLDPWEHGRLNMTERVLLARRSPGELAKTARHLDDLLRLLPPTTDRDLFLFSAAVEGAALQNPTGESLGAVKVPAVQLLFDAPKEAAPDGAAAAPPAMMPQPSGPAGGMAGLGAQPGSGTFRREGDMAKARAKRDAKPADEAAEKQAEEFDKLSKRLDDFDNFYADRRSLGRLPRAFFRKLDPTMEWAENNYYKLLITQQVADLVPVSPFWADYAKFDGKGEFLSPNLPAASRNFTEMMFAMSVLDLPFEPAEHKAEFADGRMNLVPGNRLIAFHEEVRPAEGKGGQVPILVSQNFYRHGDRFKEENGEKYDKFVTDEFVIHTVYGCQVVVTNPTSSRQRLSVLVQLPVGAMPLAGARYTRSINFDLEPYRTQTIDSLFYFPRPGTFAHFPVHVAKNEEYLASAAPFTFNVVAKPTKLDTGSWDYISQHGTSEEVLAFLVRENVRALNLDKIAFRMKDRDFFESTIRLLQERHLYHPTLYSYGIYHQNVDVSRQFLLHQDGFVAQCGGPIDSPLLVIDPVARHTYEHLEYKPLVNARAHSLGQRRQIVNDRFHEQYHKFLKTLTYYQELRETDLLAVTYYLLLQDRIEEAMAAFAKVHRDRVPTQMQYDYCAAYLAMFNEKPEQARAIAAAYVHHPVDRWRNTFAAIIAQVDEIEGRGTRIVDKDDRDQNQGNLAATEPGFEFTVSAAGVNLTWQNIDSARINYYLMDVELLFSTNPFVQRSGGQFASIRPNGTEEVAMPKGRNKHTFTLPPEFDGKNVLVEVTAAGKTRTVPHFATTMTATITENYGQLRVTETAGGKPVPKVYVKVYAKLADGSVKFHKDGYTDLRGRFDYVSVNTPERQAIERFSILVLSEDRGAIIREAAPPQR